MKYLLATTCIVLGLLAGCGGSSDSDSGGTTGGGTTGGETTGGETTGGATAMLTGSYKYFGYFDLTDDTVEDRINFEANFLEMVQPQTAEVFVNSVPPAVDSCRLSITPTIPTDVGVIGFPEAQFTLVSAGENFTLTSDAGTYATVNYSDSRFDIAPYPAPDQLVLDITGDVFPAFSNVDIPEVARVTNFSPGRNDTITAGSTITWDPTAIADDTIYFSLFDIFATDKVVNLLCRMEDDGEFNLPASTQAELNASLGAGAELEFGSQSIRSISVIVQEDAFLVVSRIIDTL